MCKNNTDKKSATKSAKQVEKKRGEENTDKKSALKSAQKSA